MRVSLKHPRHVIGGALLLTGSVLLADGIRFSDFTPLPGSAGPTADEAAPITFGNPAFGQESIADRATQLGVFKPNSGNWDMNTLNETGRHKGRYLFTVFETGQAGVQRHDLWTGSTETIWHSLEPGGHVAFDACFWTPWGTLITAEESWETASRGDLALRPPVRAQEPDRRAGHHRPADDRPATTARTSCTRT